MAAGELVGYVCGLFGFDPLQVEQAMVIRGNHDRRENVAGMTVREARERPRKKNGQARPRASVRSPGGKTGNGDGEGQRSLSAVTSANIKDARPITLSFFSGAGPGHRA